MAQQDKQDRRKKSPPNIYEVVKLFKTEQAATEVTLRQLEAGGTVLETRKEYIVQEHTEIVFLSQSPVIRWIYV